MARVQRGSLQIVAVQDQAAMEAAAELLAAADDLPREQVEEGLAHLPLLLREDIPQPEAGEIADYLHDLGVEARFAPHGRKGRRKSAKKVRSAKSHKSPKSEKAEKSAQAAQSRKKTERPRDVQSRKPGKAGALRRLSPGRDVIIPAALFVLAVGVVAWMVLQG